MSQPELNRIYDLNRDALALASAGDFGRAVPLGREAVRLARPLFATVGGLETCLALAVSLHNLGLVAAWAARRDEALLAATEAVDLFRRFTAAHPVLGRPRLADALDSLSSRLAVLGRHGDALPLSAEAVALLRLVEPTEEHRAELARCLNKHAVRLADNDRDEESLTVLTEALGLYRALDSDGSADYREGVIHVLANLALRHAALGNDAVVPGLALESVERLTALPTLHPAHESVALADSWEALAGHLARTGRYPEAQQLEAAAARLRDRAAPR
ncbi:hypothetical protein [Kitasatospora sp. NPDC088134]|uniref:hypothetical protein n=1 Tax=Kitasatospora sp. NPDC088134 TaxID=3364071 RepID=UPI003828102B